MDGKQFIDYIPEVAFDRQEPGPDHSDEVAVDPELQTLQMLDRLYGEAEQPFAPSAQEDLARIAMDSLFVDKTIKNIQTMLTPKRQPEYKTVGKKKLVRHANLDKPGRRKINDKTAGLSADEMLPISDLGLSEMREIGDRFSSQLLARGINQVIGAADRIERGKTNLAYEAGQVLRQNRQTFVRQFDMYGADTIITRTRTGDGRLLSIESTSRPWSTRTHVPNWLQGHDSWDEALHELCSHYTELDAYVAAYEWCIDRKLAAIPILSPRVLDQDLSNVSREGNLNNDLLICSLDSNVVVPMQAKTLATTQDMRKYSDEVVLVDPKRLGCVEVDHVPVDVNGNIRTGTRSRTHHGQLLTEFMRVHSPYAKGKARHQVPKIEATFDFFDREVLPKLQPAV